MMVFLIGVLMITIGVKANGQEWVEVLGVLVWFIGIIMVVIAFVPPV